MTKAIPVDPRRARRRHARKARPPVFKPRDARFRILTEHSRDIFFSMRFPEGRYEYISPCVEEHFGFAPQLFYDDPATILRCIAPAWREAVQGWIRDIALGRVAEEYEFQVVDRAGQLRWLHQRQVLEPTPDGQGMLLQGVATDVTALREVQQALEQSEAHFRQLIEAWPEQVMLSINLDAGRHEYVSPSMERVLGYAPQEFYDDPGLGLRMVAPQWQDEARAWIAEIKAGVLRPGYEFELVHKSGRHIWIHQVGALRPRAPGQDLVVQFTFRDITEERKTSEALRASEERFRELAEGWLDQVVIRINLRTGRYEYVSPGMEQIFGFSPEEFYQGERGLVGRTVAPQWCETVQTWMEELRRGVLRPEYECELIDAWGRRRWAHLRCTLLYGPDGAPEVVQGVLFDNTRRRELEEELKSSKAFLDCIIEQSPMSMWISDEKGTLIRSNQALRELFQVSEEEVVGRYNVFSDNLIQEHGLLPEIQRVFELGGTVRFMLPYDTARIKGLKLARSSAAFLDVTITAVQDAQGHTTNLIVQHLDISEHKRTEAALAASERKYRNLHESLRDGFVEVDMDGVIAEHNLVFRDMLGYSDEEIGRLTYHDITPEQWHAEEARILREQVFVRGYSDVYEKEYRRKDGTVFPVALRVYRGNNATGRPVRLWAIVRDITEQKRAEEALRQSNARNQLIVETANEGIMTIDEDKRITYSNKVMLEMLGYPEEELYQLRFSDLIFDEDMPLHEAETVRRLSGLSSRLERRFRRKDGTEVWTIFAGTPVLDANGTYCGAFGMFTDITERKRAEEALRESNARYTLLAENVVDVIWTTDERLRWTYLSPSAEKLSGIPLAKLLSMRFDELFTPQSLDRIMGLMARRRQALGQEEQDMAYRAELDIRHADGSLMPLEVLVRPMRGRGGEITGYCGTSRDITERKRAEEALRLSEARYALALRGANDGIWDWDLVENKVYYSDRWKEIIGYAPDELRHDADEWVSRIHPEDHAQIMAANMRCAAGEVPVFQMEYRLRHKDGNYRWIFERGAALADASGRVVRMAGALTDITGRKQAEEALLKSERLARKLLESMHEGIWAVDASRRTTFVNERLCTMLGYSSAELMNMSPMDVLEWPQRQMAENRIPDAEDGFAGATDYVLIRKDGSRFPAHVVSSPIMEGRGRFEGLVCGVLDLTERARMELELRRNQARFEALYELSRLTPATEQQLASFTLREAIRLTDSSAGVLFFVSPDGQTLVPKAWETEDFSNGSPVPSFPASGSMPWARVLQSAQPLLLNDFSEFAAYIPAGHPAVTRLLGVPALDGQRPVAVLGLTGKVEPYLAEDTLQTTLLLDGMWRVVRARRDEERIRASLRKKDALLHEVHHRVKNNLQVISSLLDMAGRRLSNPEARLSLNEVRGKVQAMSLIHAQLHGSESAGGINLERYVRALFGQLRELYSGDLSLSLVVKLSNLALGLDQAVPLGLALNEALTNVFKHACSGGRAGRVDIRAGQDAQGQVCILVRDDGPGLPEGLDPGRAQSLGMKLMFGLVRHQLGGKLEILNCAAPERPGVEVCICFRSNIAK